MPATKVGAAIGGSAKVPRVGVNKSDLEALAEEHGWTVRPLTFKDVQAMSSSELRWHEVWNAEALKRAFELEQNRRTNAERHPIWETRRMYSGKATPEESAAARDAAERFSARFPQFARTLENAQAMVAYMEAHDLDATRVESYVTAFRDLSEQGKLTLAKAQSADEFYEAHAELHDNRVPPLIAARHAREENTAAHFAKSASATSEGGVTRIVDYDSRGTAFRQRARSIVSK